MTALHLHGVVLKPQECRTAELTASEVEVSENAFFGNKIDNSDALFQKFLAHWPRLALLPRRV
jgi:hypothetical protein